jgi:hypothetical protein
MSGIIKDKNYISIEGSLPGILADVSLITQAVYESFVENGIPTEEAKKIIDDAVELGMATQAEIKQRTKEALTELLNLLEEGDNDDETGNTSSEDSEDTDR